MVIRQFEDKNLAHFSYAILSKGQVAVIDPARDPQPYYDFAKQHNAVITAVIETHPHADFVSSHLQIHNETGATVYVSRLLGALYEHESFDEGDAIVLGDITLKALNTPGHSPDSISIVTMDEKGKERAVFTGDTLFIGDCGRPDLREKAGTITAARTELAKQMYHSLRDKLMTLPDDVLVYPAHGAGSLCGKGLSDQLSSTIGAEKISNWSLGKMSEDVFVSSLLSDQPFVPKYFPFDVEVNKAGAEGYIQSISKVPVTQENSPSLDPSVMIIDTRPQDKFKRGHLPRAINLMNDTKFETWLGSIINPGEPFYLIAESEAALNELLSRTAKIGYEKQVKLAFVSGEGKEKTDFLDVDSFRQHTGDYTIVDIRNASEVKGRKIFDNTLHIPLHELRERVNEIPAGKPVVVHCAGGYRSAAGSSIVQSEIGEGTEVFDLGEAVKTFIYETVK